MNGAIGGDGYVSYFVSGRAWKDGVEKSLRPVAGELGDEGVGDVEGRFRRRGLDVSAKVNVAGGIELECRDDGPRRERMNGLEPGGQAAGWNEEADVDNATHKCQVPRCSGCLDGGLSLACRLQA